MKRRKEKKVLVSGGRVAWILILASIILMEVRRGSRPVNVGPHACRCRRNLPFVQDNQKCRSRTAEARDSTPRGDGDDKDAQRHTPYLFFVQKDPRRQGYWNQAESYVRDHSDAEFSHGLCPECAKRLYPEIFDKAFDKERSLQ